MSCLRAMQSCGEEVGGEGITGMHVSAIVEVEVEAVEAWQLDARVEARV